MRSMFGWAGREGCLQRGETDECKQLLLRIASILTRLIERFDFSSSSSIIREEAFEDADENENEHEQS
jgi:hypothetical protein